ncbi:MAG: Vms1/Ankzf1 family peptidyl-tRNA hydrolase [Gaiellaceae bacterium]
MARTVTWDELRELARVEAGKGVAISVYLGLDPGSSPTAGDAQTRLNSLLDEGARQDGASAKELDHRQRVALREDFERIRRWFETEFDRDGTRGLAVFCSSLDGLWRPLPLSEPVPDGVEVGSRLHLAPLVALVGRGDGALVVVVSREQGRFYRLRDGRLEELADYTEEQPRRHDQGGWSQARMQRHVDELAQDHLRRVAEELDRLVRRLDGTQVVVIASEESAAEFPDLVSQETRAAIAGIAPAEAHAQASELLAAAMPVLERKADAREAELVERWRESAGREGRASSGWETTLAAASDGRVETLLVQEGSNREALRCPQCGRAIAAGETCPLDGARLVGPEDGLELAVHQTLAHGGTVWPVRRGRDLDPVEGIGAILRF